ncbi:HET domain protein [Dactylonectria macrodidyma]|uniref:HET domain protein n=1 Tax=Dactylonectria macrodidyma TaxID=307937 RepID=A0A9P9FQ63_9HYPO|nr:HET domain protein [Dactylonectria macrodidyma]
MDQSQMTLTHLEGMQIARELGYRYIWIDTLCIMQDSNRDWEHSARLVPDIYGNAALTILAGRSDDSRSGFVNLANWYKPEALPVEVPYALSQGTVYEPSRRQTCRLHLPRIQNLGPAYRLIAFGMEQLMLKCRETVSFEDSFGESAILDQTIPHEIELSRDLVVTICSEERHSLQSALGEWHNVMRIYSIRSIFDPFDCYAALSGLARRYETALAWASYNAKPRYLAGMWETNKFFRELLWRRSREPLRRPRRGQGPQPSKAVERAPSWSWMALEGPSKDWGIDLVLDKEIQKSLPFSIEVRGRPRRALLSTVPLRSFDFVPETAPRCSDESTPQRAYPIAPRRMCDRLKHQGVVLKDGESELPWPVSESPIGIGLLGLEGEDNTELWALPTSLHGVLKANGAFRRVGVLWVRSTEIFIQTK